MRGAKGAINPQSEMKQDKQSVAEPSSGMWWTGERAAVYIGLPFLNRCLVGQKVSRETRFTGLAPIP